MEKVVTRTGLRLRQNPGIFTAPREWWNGRHARLRIWSRKGWRFKSSLAHHSGSFPGQKINHEHVRHERPYQGLEFLVFRVDEVGVPVLLVLESDEEAMREALVEFLR